MLLFILKVLDLSVGGRSRANNTRVEYEELCRLIQADMEVRGNFKNVNFTISLLINLIVFPFNQLVVWSWSLILTKNLENYERCLKRRLFESSHLHSGPKILKENRNLSHLRSCVCRIIDQQEATVVYQSLSVVLITRKLDTEGTTSPI